MQLVIEMPGGMSSRPHDCSGYTEKMFDSWAAQMRAWPRFEAWLLILEDRKEIYREHIRT